MTNFHLRGTGQEDHSLLNEDQVVVKKKIKHLGDASRRLRVTSCRCWTLVAFLSALWMTFFGLWVYCNYFKGSHWWTEVVGHNVDADLVVLPQELAERSGAYCLDGSPPSYYFRNASSEEDGKSWIIHLHGGAWCYNTTTCGQRSTTDLGSSRMLSPRQQFHGILSANSKVNPDFFDWNMAVINYCDGASFSGNREDPVLSYNNTKIYYRGVRVLDAVVNYLLQSAGLAKADNVILSGGSAGALGVYLHADRIRSMIPDANSFKAIADGGFFLDEKNASGREQWGATMRGVYDMQHVEGSLDEDCLLAKGGSNKWECFLPEYAYPYVTTPIFIINSVYDRWALENILNLPCRPSQCKYALNRLEEHMQTFLRRTDQVNRYDKDGMFVSSCYANCQAVLDTPWTTYVVAGKTVKEAFADWYFERSTPAGSRYVDCDSSYKCNPTCSETWKLD